MKEIPVFDIEGKEIEKIAVPEDIYCKKVDRGIMYSVAVNHLANRRMGTSSSKSRSEVRGGGRKPWRQKGTGRARHGSIRSPLWVGGGVTHGPKPRDLTLSIPKKIADLALKSALSLKAKEGKIKILRELTFKKPKTTQAATLLKKLKLGKSVLLLAPEKDLGLQRSFRNIKGVEVRIASNVNAYDVSLAGDTLFLKEAIGRLKERLGK